MSWGTAEGRDKLSALDNLSIEISKKGSQTADSMSDFVKPAGSPMGRYSRMSPDFDLKEELLSGRVKVLTKTNCPEWHNKGASKHPSYFYNSFSRQLSVTIRIGSLRNPSKIDVLRLTNVLATI